MCLLFGFFFFSSRRRHTMCGRDWSSDVCSSDLDEGVRPRRIAALGRVRDAAARVEVVHLLRGDVELGDAAPELVDRGEALYVVVLRVQAERVGPDAEVRVLRDEDGRGRLVLLEQVEGDREDLVVGGVPVARAVRQLAGGEQDPDPPLLGADGDTLTELPL